MSITPFDRDVVRLWQEMGEIPDDLSTRRYAAETCARLVAAYDAVLAAVVDDRPVQMPGQGELFGEVL